MGTRSKAGYCCDENRKSAGEHRRQPKERPPRVLTIARYRLRTRKYRRIK